MRRKIIKQGSATLTLSLPAKWTKKLNLKQGDEVEVEQKDNTLVIGSAKAPSVQKEVVDLTQFNHLLKRIIAAKYLKGIDEIEVKFNSIQKARTIQNRVREMIGMEVIQQGKNFLIIKDLSSTTENAFDPILRRVFFMINTMAEESLKALRKKETDLAYLEDIEANINRFTDHCFRILNKFGYPEQSKTPVIYTIVLLLEQLADEYKILTKFITQNRMVLRPQEIALLERIHKLFRNFESLFYDFSYEKAVSIAKERDNIIGELSNRLEKTSSVKDSQILGSLKEMSELIVRMMGQTLNLA